MQAVQPIPLKSGKVLTSTHRVRLITFLSTLIPEVLKNKSVPLTLARQDAK